MFITDRNFFYHKMTVQIFLDRVGSYLKDEKIGKQAISLFIERRCKSYNINPRVLLTLLDLRAGLLSRKDRPEEHVTNWCLGMVPRNSAETGLDYCRGLRMQIEAALSMLETFFLEGRFNKSMVLKFEEAELAGLNAASYALVQYLWITDHDISFFERYSSTYQRWFGNDPRRDHDGAAERDKGKTPKRNTRVPDPQYPPLPRPLSASSSNVRVSPSALVPQ